MPTVSIITPLYNKAAYIADTICSVLTQTYMDWELLIVDNGSTDGSWNAAQQIQDQRIRLMRSPRRGPGAARNIGLAQATGEWIQFLDADDLLEPDHLQLQLSAAQQAPQAHIIACCWQEFTANNPSELVLKQPLGIQQTASSLIDTAIAFAPWAVHAAMVKRCVISPDCYWNEQLDQFLGEDIAFWFRLLDRCTVAYGHSQGALYRVHTPQCRTQNHDAQKWFAGIHAAIQANQHYWQQQGQTYTQGQCESLTRVYSQLYLLARQQSAVDIESQALSCASKWLNEYCRVAPNPRFFMLVRRLLGVKLFLHLRSTLFVEM